MRPTSSPVLSPRPREASARAAAHGVLAAAVVWLSCGQAAASVFTNGDVRPADNPFTLTTNEGLPVDGNFIDPFANPLSDQPNYEGAADVEVGNHAFGLLLITGESALRYQDLIIGGSEVPPGSSGTERQGTGVVRITGFGSLYSNDPLIVPQALIDEGYTTTRDPGFGYDLFIGREGNGTLEITNGARAEIQDAIIMGDESNASGTLIVDGIDSFLQSGNFEAGSGSNTDPHLFYVGRLGTGFAQITNGAQVVSGSFISSSGVSDDIFAAVIGGDVVDGSQAPMAGGLGTMTVDGFGSKWIIGSGLQLGSYHDAMDSAGGDDDFDGDDVEYDSDVGQGTLIVRNEGLVSITTPPNALTGVHTQLAIGRFGRLEMDGGTVIVGSPLARTDDVFLSNDGVIRGDGRIDTGVFRNRFLGEIRIGQDQHLLINSTSEFEGPSSDDEPLNNWGLVEVLGGELEVVRTTTPSTSGTVEMVAAFRNNRLTIPPASGRSAGLIVAQHGTLRFGSGLINEGTLAFTAGPDNLVAGDVVNDGESMPGMADEGLITIAGHETFVTFENDLTNAGTIDISPDATGFIVLGDFDTTMGTLSMVLGGGESGREFSHIVVGETATLGGLLEVSLFSSGADPLTPMAGDAFEILSANGGLVGDFTSFSLPPLAPMLGWVPIADPLAGTYTLTVLGVPVTAIGADFNGDGIVDADDYLIWLANIGNPGGLGDANGDGRVDGRDFLIWQAQLGGAGMTVPGSGSGSALGSVPEPSSGLLLMLALASLAGLRSGRFRSLR